MRKGGITKEERQTGSKSTETEVKQRQLCIAKKRRGNILERITQNIRSIRKDYQ